MSKGLEEMKRYDFPTFCQECGGEPEAECDNGTYVKYEDHKAEVERLRKALERINKFYSYMMGVGGSYKEHSINSYNIAKDALDGSTK